MQEALDELGAFAAARGIEFTPHKRRAVEERVGALVEYNKKTNLTADQEPEAMVLRHVADGFAAVPILKQLVGEERPRLADVGSGGGFIGFGLKIAWPEAEVTLIEALQRKYDFLNLAAMRAELKGLRVVRKTVGKGAEGREKDFAAVVSRALAPLPEALALTAPLARAGGLVAVYQSEPLAAINAPGLEPLRCASYRLPSEDKDRFLAIFRRAS